MIAFSPTVYRSLLVVTENDSAYDDATGSTSARANIIDSTGFLVNNLPRSLDKILLPCISFLALYFRNSWNGRSIVFRGKKSGSGLTEFAEEA
jgi:hypothetical protein